jgi:NAD(P) transhydrogenase
VLNMDRIPKSLAVVGGGFIGCEYATIFTALGIPVTLVESKPRLLSFIDGEIAERLHKHLVDLGMTILLNEEYGSMEKGTDAVTVHMKSGKEFIADKVLVAAGRYGNTKNLGLEKLKIVPNAKGQLAVNLQFQTSVPNVYAAGDVIGFPSLASTSMEQGRVAMCHAFKLEYKKQVSPFIPLAVYSIPEISYAGATEEMLKEKKIPYCVGRATFELNARGQIIGDLSGMIKLLFSPSNQKLLGVHIIGEGASELVHIGLFVLSQGLTIDYFIQSVFNFPTLSEAYKYAAYDGLGNLQKMK